jgi:hypothetical protein
MAYQYHAFISYSSQDRPWAQKLSADLTDAGLRIFMDERDLEAGHVWPDELMRAIRASQHLVVVWTNHARSSAWVNKEMATFDSDAGATERVQPRVDRRMLSVLLDGQPDAYATLQTIPHLRDLNAYTAGPAAFDAALKAAWAGVVHELVRILRRTLPGVSIPAAIVAMTDREAAGLTGAETIAGRATPLDTLLTTIGIAPAAAGRAPVTGIAGWYGAGRADWHPFGGPDPVRVLLDHVVGAMNTLATGVDFDWDEVDFLSPPFATAQQAVGQLDRPISLVLVDPLSFYYGPIALNFNLLSGCFRRAGTLVLTLPPFGLSAPHASLRQLVQMGGAPLFDVHYQPPVPYYDHATCGINVGDVDDLGRMLRQRIGHYVRVQEPPPANPFTELTSRRP